MALVQITPMVARIRWDRHAGLPNRIEWGGRQLAVSGVGAVRG